MRVIASLFSVATILCLIAKAEDVVVLSSPSQQDHVVVENEQKSADHLKQVLDALQKDGGRLQALDRIRQQMNLANVRDHQETKVADDNLGKGTIVPAFQVRRNEQQQQRSSDATLMTSPNGQSVLGVTPDGHLVRNDALRADGSLGFMAAAPQSSDLQDHQQPMAFAIPPMPFFPHMMMHHYAQPSPLALPFMLQAMRHHMMMNRLRHHHHHHHLHRHMMEMMEAAAAAAARPKVFVETVKIKERIMVDEKNQPKGLFGADIQKSIYTVNSGRLQRLAGMNATIQPKDGHPLLFKNGEGVAAALDAGLMSQNVDSNHHHLHGETADGQTEEADWVDRWIGYFHLDEFGPRLFASLLLGFFATALLYGIAYAIVMLYHNHYGEGSLYEEVDDGSGKMSAAMASNAELLDREEKRMTVTVPAVPTI